MGIVRCKDSTRRAAYASNSTRISPRATARAPASSCRAMASRSRASGTRAETGSPKRKRGHAAAWRLPRLRLGLPTPYNEAITTWRVIMTGLLHVAGCLVVFAVGQPASAEDKVDYEPLSRLIREMVVKKAPTY